jgi:DNA/RNA-binding domain of Phe-tRNA-synthetase-like protein
VDAALSVRFREVFPDGFFGILIVHGCPNHARATALSAPQRAVEARLRARFADRPMDDDPVARVYAGYFKRYGQRYPVAHQARTILAGRPIESPSALVAAMFTAEVDTLVLTSGHDLDILAGPLLVDVGREGERYTKINGKDQAIAAGDMVVRDAHGVIASVVYGPDFRTRFRETTQAALFGAWCPVGLTRETAAAHLDALAALLRLEWPSAVTEAPRVLASRDP